MDPFYDQYNDQEEEQVIEYIADVHFEDTLTPDEEYYDPNSEAVYIERSFPKINGEQWEMVSSELFSERRERGKK